MKKVFVEVERSDDQWSYPLMKGEFRECLPQFGWSFSDSKSADVHFRDYRCLTDLSMLSRPTIAFMRADMSWPFGGELGRNLDGHDSIVGFVVPIMTTNPSLSIARYVWGSIIEFTKPVCYFTTMLWHQLNTSTCYLDIDPVDKTWDVCFIGTMHHDGSPFVKEHRANLRRAWGTLDEYSSVSVFDADARHGYLIPWPRTWRVIRRTKTVVSPWGICEISWRDYEAALAGCMMIKPRQPEIKATCSPWHKENVIYCEPDYSDLADRVQESLDKADESALRKISRDTLAAGVDFNVLAKAFAGVLDKCST